MSGATLDTGALIAIERGSRRIQALLDEAAVADAVLAVPAGVVGQAWRGQARQARLARFLRQPNVDVVALDNLEGRERYLDLGSEQRSFIDRLGGGALPSAAATDLLLRRRRVVARGGRAPLLSQAGPGS